MNGGPAGETTDHFAPKPGPSGPIALGSFAPVDGAYLLRIEVTGKNPKSKAAFFGIDCVCLNGSE